MRRLRRALADTVYSSGSELRNDVQAVRNPFGDATLVDSDLESLKEAWQKPLRW